jgi:type VI secretion system FHA domain protein
MTLTLSVLRCPDAVPPETKRVNGGEFRIGRGLDNDWVMPDPDKLLSKKHCVVAYRNGGWAIADTSTNGTFINRDSDPLGPGQIRDLSDGDRIRFGAYEIEVRIDDGFNAATTRSGGYGAAAPARSPFDDPFADDVFATRAPPPETFSSSAFGNDPLFGGPAPSQSVTMPTRYDPMAPPTDDDFFAQPTLPDHSPSYSDAFRPPPVAPKLIPDDDWDLGLPGTKPAAPLPPPAAYAPPLPAYAPPAPPAYTPPQPAAYAPPPPPAYTPPPAPAPAAYAPTPAPAAYAPSPPAYVPPPEPAYAPPAAAPQQQWQPAPQPAAFAPPPPAPQPALAPQQWQAPPAAPAPASPSPFLEDDEIASTIPQHRPAPPPAAPSPPQQYAPPAPQPAAPPPQQYAPPPAPISAPPTTLLAANAAAAAGDLLGAFLAGAGIKARPESPDAMMFSVGAAFRAMVAGIRQALIARSSIKGEFRIEQTMIRARGNNPLKFSADDDDALSALLGVGRRTDVKAEAAVADALRDMRLHELATVAAMQGAVRAMLAQLDPARLRAEADNAGGMNVLPAQKKARAFEAYEKLHDNVTRALTDDFDSVFGKSFARAYETALRDISAKDVP